MNKQHIDPATRWATGAEAADHEALTVRVAWHQHGAVAALHGARLLLDRTAAPFCTQPMWLSMWYARAKARPLAVVVERRGTTVGLACLAVRRTGPLHTVTLAGDGPSDYGRLPAGDPTAAGALASGIARVLTNLGGPWRLRLSQLPVADPVATALRDALPGARLEPAQGCPAMAFGSDRAPAGHLSTKARRAARRGRARLAEVGVEVTTELVSDAAQVAERLPEIVALHRARDRALGRRSDLDQLSRRAFYVSAVRALADAGQLDVWVLRLDGTLGAFVVGVRDGSSYRTLDARIADEWQSVSPGQILRTEMITRLLADPGLAELDWMRGEQRHKMQDATHVVAAEQLLAESSPWVTAGLRSWHALRQEIRDRVPGQARRWLRSHGGTVSGAAARSRAAHATSDAGRAAPRPPGAADGSRGPS
jgi:CelD/BcsL family acetyltransferase involved in cellulose biosynthesis